MFLFFILFSLISFLVLIFVLQKKPIYIALAIPETGYAKAYGEEMRRGVQLYLEQVNRQGGINGHKIHVRIFDDQGDIASAKKAAEQIVAQQDINLVIGHKSSGTTLAASPVYHQARIPAITGSATNEQIAENNPWYYSLPPNNSMQGKFAAEYIRILADKPVIHIVYNTGEFGTSLKNAFVDRLEQMFLYPENIWSVAETDTLQQRTTVFTEIAGLLNGEKQEAILYMALKAEDIVELIPFLQKKQNITWMCPDTCVGHHFMQQLQQIPQERARPGYYSDGIYATVPFITDVAGATAQQFRQDFRQRYGQEPDWISALYYDAARLAVAGLQYAYAKPGDDTDQIRSRIKQYFDQHYVVQNSIQGVTGDIYFNSVGQSQLPVSIGIYQQQKLISAKLQFRPVLYQLPVIDVLNKLLHGEAFFIDGTVLDGVPVVYTGIDMNSIRNINLAAGTYMLDVYLWFRFARDFSFDDQDIEFINADAPVVMTPVKQEIDKDYQTRAYRVQGRFRNNFLFHDYPFDKQNIILQFRHKKLKRNALIYVPDILAMQPDQTHKLQQESGWLPVKNWHYQDVMHNQSTLGIPRHFGQRNDLDYSRFNMIFQIKRDTAAFMIKNLLPVFLMLMIAYIAYFMPVQKVEMRMGLGSSSLLTSAFFHLQLTSGLHVSYTLAIEYFFYTIYILNGMLIFLAICTFYTDKILADCEEEKRKAVLQRYLFSMNLAGRILHPSIVASVICWMVYQYA